MKAPRFSMAALKRFGSKGKDLKSKNSSNSIPSRVSVAPFSRFRERKGSATRYLEQLARQSSQSFRANNSGSLSLSRVNEHGWEIIKEPLLGLFPMHCLTLKDLLEYDHLPNYEEAARDGRVYLSFARSVKNANLFLAQHVLFSKSKSAR